jgi:hypothetical protein
MEQDLFWAAAPGARLLDTVGQRWEVLLPAVFIACWQRSLSVPKPAKQNGGQLATIVLSGTRGPWLFLVIREGLGSGVRLGARSTQRLTYQLRLALEPECLENPMATAREDPRDGADALRDTQAVCGFRCWASKLTPLFHTINTMVAIFLARVSRAISGRMPLANSST